MNDQTVGTEADPGAPSRVAVSTRSPWLMLAMATIGFAVNFWAWALISPLGPLFRDDGNPRHSHRVRRRAHGRRARGGGLPRADPGGGTHRQARWPGDVPARLRGHDPADPVPGVLRPGLLRPDPGGRLLPRHRRHRVCGRGAVRERLVPAREAWPGDRHLRCGHGRDGDQRADHREALREPGREVAVPDHRRRARRLRRSGLADPARRTGPDRADHVAGGPASRPTRGSRSPGRRASSTPSPSVGTSRSRSTSRRTSRPHTGSPRPTPRTGWPGSWSSR